MTIEPSEPLQAAGERLWRSVLERFALDAHELEVLEQACRTADLIAALDAERGGEVLSGTGRKVHPAIGEVRQQRLVLARLVAALRLPDDVEAEKARKQHRSLRGVQAMG